MTRDAKRVLKGLKTAQMTQEQTVHIDYDTCMASTVAAGGQPHASFDFTKYSTSIEAILDYLEKNGLIDSNDQLGRYYQVNHVGWNYSSFRRKEIFSDILKSLITPIVVSVITTLITLWISNLFAQ